MTTVRGGNAIDYAYREAGMTAAGDQAGIQSCVEAISGDHEFSIDHLVAFAS